MNDDKMSAKGQTCFNGNISILAVVATGSSNCSTVKDSP